MQKIQYDFDSLHVQYSSQDQAQPHEIFLVKAGHEKKIFSRLSHHPEVTPAILFEIEAKLKEATDDLSFFFIPFEVKGGVFVWIENQEKSSYLTDVSLRKNLASVLKSGSEAKHIRITALGFSKKKEAALISALYFLASIQRGESAVFGKKAGKVKKKADLHLAFQSQHSTKELKELLEEAKITAQFNGLVRYLADLPSNVLHPGSYKEFALQLAKSLKVKASFHGVKELKKMNANAFLAVIQGDHHERGGIVHLQYMPNQKPKKKIALIGKGLCFDTGGYNVKTGDFMYNMHRDMTGSAVALSLFSACVELKMPIQIDCYLALAENLIAHNAYRPNDVIVASNGLSIEVVNTDAEGRMVLSDTLVLASKSKPDFMIDFATLTGSVVRSLDTRRCGAYSNDLKMSQLAVEVGEECGERVWNFPIGEDYEDSLKSEIADTRQLSSSNAADHIYAATFLSKFVEEGVKWMHIDLAADTNKGGLGIVPFETTGFGVRFGVNFIRQMAKI